MGPVNTKLVKGRGDATLATKKLIENLKESESLRMFDLKYQQLTEKEQQELSDIFGGEDI